MTLLWKCFLTSAKLQISHHPAASTSLHWRIPKTLCALGRTRGADDCHDGWGEAIMSVNEVMTAADLQDGSIRNVPVCVAIGPPNHPSRFRICRCSLGWRTAEMHLDSPTLRSSIGTASDVSAEPFRPLHVTNAQRRQRAHAFVHHRSYSPATARAIIWRCTDCCPVYEDPRRLCKVQAAL